jgi:cell wall-associated NlpC family hydrolase
VIRDVLEERSTLSRTRARFRAYFLTAIAVAVLSAIPADAVLATAPAATATTTSAPATTTSAPATTTTLVQTALSVASTANLGPGTGTDAGTTAPVPAAVAPGTPTVPTTPNTVLASSAIVALARTHLGARYRYAATGPTSFDCSGLVWRVFEQAHLGRMVTSHSARAIYLAYRKRGLASRSNPQVGDLVLWGYGSHVGIYIGRGLAISALVGGVRVHRVNALTTAFTAYLHTDLAGIQVSIRYLPRSAHASAKPTKPTTAKLSAKPSATPIAHATVALRLRTGHSISNAAIATLAAGTRFHVLARALDGSHRLWLKVRLLDGRTGWLAAAYTHA